MGYRLLLLTTTVAVVVACGGAQPQQPPGTDGPARVGTVRVAGEPLTATVPHAGDSSGVSGGFWSRYAVPTPGAPVLKIAPAGFQQIVLSCEPGGVGWILQETPTLQSTNWLDSLSLSTNPVTLSVTSPVKWYRLRKP